MFIYSFEKMSDICSPNSADKTKVLKIKQEIISENAATEISKVLKALSDPTRIKIISALSNAELCVCEIALALNLSQSLVSHQLQALRLLGLVKLRKEGRNMHYSLSNESTLRIIEECQRMMK